MAASLFLSGCSVRKDTSDSENSGSSNGSGSGDRVVNVCSWGEYIDESLIDQFEEETGIKSQLSDRREQRGPLFPAEHGRRGL